MNDDTLLSKEDLAEFTKIIKEANPDKEIIIRNTPELVAALSEEVELIEPNFIYYQDQQSGSDPLIGNMWFLDPIMAPSAWQVRSGSEGIVVAVIDTGLFFEHEDLVGNIWTNQLESNGQSGDYDDSNGLEDDLHCNDFYNSDPDPSPDFVTRPNGVQEFEAHGTHVAGTIGAVGDNPTGILGITRKVQIMPIKALGGPRGSGDTINLLAAIDYAVQNGATVINASWGGGGRSRAMELAIERANSAGVLFVAAAGNGGADVIGDDNDQTAHFPSSYTGENIIAVAATGPGDMWARLPSQPAGVSFSNYGLVSVDLAAPGQRILSTIPTGANPREPRSGYADFNGTSMATPIVSGTVALMRAEFPTMNHLEIRKLLLDSVDHVPTLSGRLATGGRLNMIRALRPVAPTLAIANAAVSRGSEVDEALGRSTAEAAENAKMSLRPGLSAFEQAQE